MKTTGRSKTGDSLNPGRRIRKNRTKSGKPGNTGLIARLRRVGGIALALAGVLAMSLLFVFIHDVLTQCAFFKAKSVVFEGGRMVNREQALSIARVGEGVNVLSINLATARRRLVAHPWIADAQVRRVLPDRFEITIKEHRALAVLDLGRRFLINESGEVFKEQEARDPKSLPTVRGLTFSDVSVPGQPRTPAFAAVMEVLNLSLEPGSAIPIRNINAVSVDRDLGLTVRAFKQPVTIHLGYSDYLNKYNRLRNVLAYLENNGQGLTGIRRIDLNDSQRVVVSPTDA